MGLANFVVLAWLMYVGVPHSCQTLDECFDDPPKSEYICHSESGKTSCDCEEENTCHFEFVLRNSGQILTINGEFQGPTLIVKANAIVVVDVVNNMVEETSIHWHGMHQYNVPWMDGVGNITQWSIRPGRKFRYIFEATPTGTHWYHSHVGLQRSKGLFGALIVKEDSAPDYLNIGEFEDKPDEHTLVITENGIVAAKSEPSENLCYEDGSRVASQISSFVPVVNGIELAGKTQKTFYVDYGKTYRFRLIGAMAGTAYQFSIDSHKLIVVATDGYLVKRFETDYIIFHTGERYDFLLDATETSSKSYPIRIELLTINCDSKMKRKAIVGIALLTYNYSPYSSSDAIFKYSNSRCNEKKKCTVFNCPFKAYADGVPKTCHHVDELELVDETPEDEVPDSDNIDLKRTLFFDFGSKLTVNNKHFEIPHIALQVSSYTGKINECNHDTDCSTSDNPKCVHIVDIGKQFYKKGMRFVLSSLGDMSRAIFTHPIHLHGHSFHVVKIGYPSYTSEGIIKDITQDLQRSECGGPPSWKNGVPEIMAATEETVRKDTIMVPAGGYVVIEFLADNPGYWFFHCHIEPHLHRGMAAVIRETKACQNQDIPSGLRESDKNFCWTVEDFIRQKMWKNPCEAALDDPAALQDQSKSDKPLPKERQAELEKKDSRISWKDPRAWRLKQAESAPFMDRWERRFKGKVHASKERPFLSDWNFHLRKKGSAEHK